MLYDDEDFEISKGVLTFYWGKEEKVKIPSTVKIIGERAFKDCEELKEIIIPNSVIEIQNEAFRSCSNLKKIKIPKSVKTIREGAFDLLSNLTAIDVDKDNPYFASMKGILYDKKIERLIRTPEGMEGDIKIPDTVTCLESRSFEFCDFIESITIPFSVEKIGNCVFCNCTSLKNLVVDKDNKNYASINYIIYNKKQTKLIAAAGGLDGEIRLPDTVTSIGDNAFDGCENINKIRIPDSVIEIGKEAFAYCSKLTEIKIPDSVKSIGEDAFTSCSYLEKIIVDEYNKNYTSIDGVLYDKELETLLYVPNSARGTVKIPNTVTCIEAFSFADCEDITKIKIPDSVKSIEGGAFYNCRRLKSVTFGKGLDTIWKGAFENCENLTEAIIPDSVKIIEAEAFKYCIKLKKVVLGENIETIGEEAFSECESLTSIIIPESVTSIGRGAFGGVLGELKKITVPRHLEDYFTGEYGFKSDNSECKVIVK